MAHRSHVASAYGSTDHPTARRVRASSQPNAAPGELNSHDTADQYVIMQYIQLVQPIPMQSSNRFVSTTMQITVFHEIPQTFESTCISKSVSHALIHSVHASRNEAGRPEESHATSLLQHQMNPPAMIRQTSLSSCSTFGSCSKFTCS